MNRALVSIGLFAVCTALSAWAGNGAAASADASAAAKAAKAKPLAATSSNSRLTVPVIPDPGNLPVTEVSVDADPALVQSTDGSDAPAAPAKPSLGDAIISQGALHIYLDHPASISLFSARGQLVYRLESSRAVEILPLQGLPTGFLYLTLRAGPYELTKKLVYSGR